MRMLRGGGENAFVSFARTAREVVRTRLTMIYVKLSPGAQQFTKFGVPPDAVAPSTVATAA